MKREKKNKKKMFVNYDKYVDVVNIGDVCTEYMQVFGANNNIQRHLPDVSDGLKIGERRILYTMWMEGYRHTSKSFKKVATITGKVLDYHPHGESSVNETIIKLAQPWVSKHPLIDGSGNFGSYAGDPAGAPRYIEARLSFFAYKCFFEDFSPDVVDMRDNYTRDKKEPEYLPAKYPNILISNTFGIGYGISTSIPNYNFMETLKLTMELMDNPKYEPCILIPDTPTGAYIVDEGQFKEICETGQGKVKYRGRIDIEPDTNCLVVRSTPPQTSWIDIRQKVLETLKSSDGKTNMVYKLSDDAEGNVLEYRIYLKKEVDPYQVRENIYKKTLMEKTLPVRFKAVEDFLDMDYNLRQLLLTWINFRRETKRRYYNNLFVKNTERKHILEIILKIFDKDNAEKTIAIMKKSANRSEIIEKLMKAYGMTSLQAREISELKGYQYSQEYQKRYRDEADSLTKQLVEIDEILRSPKKLDKIIKKELKEGIELFGRDRVSEVIQPEGEKVIADTKHIMVFTKNGLVKKLPIEVKNIGHIANNDYPSDIIEVENTKDLLIFDERGSISKLAVYDMPGTILNSEGDPIARYCPDIKGNIVSIKAKATEEEIKAIPISMYMLMLTENGIIKKTPYVAYSNIRSGLMGLVLRPDDKLIAAKILLGDKDVLVYTNKGRGVRFSSVDVKETSRMSMGVIGISLDDDEKAIGFDILNSKDKYIFAMTDGGSGKLCPLDAFNTMPRNTKPLNILPIEGKQNICIIRTVKGDEQFKVYTKDRIDMIKVEDVPEIPRMAKGKKIYVPGRGNYIIDIKEYKEK